MKIVIPAISEDCPAALALRKEGVFFELVLMHDDISYSKFLCDLWKAKESFVLIEHDIVPWPGAIRQLIGCPKLWCSYQYPLAPYKLRPALGCMKVKDTVINHYPSLHLEHSWSGRHWSQMDGPVCSALENSVGKTHIHNPPLAHVKL